MLIGEVGFMTRNMLTNRAGRPRSCTSATTDAPIAPSAPTFVTVASWPRPVACDPAASSDAPPARPPRNR